MEIDGHEVTNLTDFRFKIADYPPHSTVSMKVWQNGKIKKLKFSLGDRSEYIKLASQPKPDKSEEWLGIKVAETDGVEGHQLGIDDLKGVVVLNINQDSPALGLFEIGDVIVEVGGKEINSVEDFTGISEDLKDRKKAIPFWIIRGGRRMFIPIRPES